MLGARLSHLEAAALGTSDTARSLADQPGYSVNAAGGVSALPALRGLADDRIKILLDGAESTAACGNHMNAPLSYVSPGQVGSVRVIPGLSPVSLAATTSPASSPSSRPRRSSPRARRRSPAAR
ncbi:TonB-dependent receptor plug domain-containing protein [Chitinimonas koreensis]|uniref:TonB-dependent receptor plug domain-containing protein n=1 Tax=Chitinimonas koreensis TaxID=356302 RepID=UPI001654A871|nr:TonB-dependent receptor plug domain-containing protein [Chitinimonas koreensis]QNM95312.1 TonB-dependent receptor plug domain-containing protein [Chitinimonas koreensis]